MSLTKWWLGLRKKNWLGWRAHQRITTPAGGDGCARSEGVSCRRLADAATAGRQQISTTRSQTAAGGDVATDSAAARPSPHHHLAQQQTAAVGKPPRSLPPAHMTVKGRVRCSIVLPKRGGQLRPSEQADLPAVPPRIGVPRRPPLHSLWRRTHSVHESVSRTQQATVLCKLLRTDASRCLGGGGARTPRHTDTAFARRKSETCCKSLFCSSVQAIACGIQ